MATTTVKVVATTTVKEVATTTVKEVAKWRKKKPTTMLVTSKVLIIKNCSFHFNNIGRGLGPLIVSWMVEAMGSRARGYDIAMAAWWLDALFMALTYFTVEADEATARGKGRNKKWEKV